MKIIPSLVEANPDLQALIDRSYPEQTKETEHWDGKVHQALTLISAEPDKLVWEFKVEDKHCHQMDNLQGGCVATVIDVCSTFALAVHQSWHKWSLSAVSSEISVNYLKGIPSFDTARVECEVLRVGGSLANVYSRIYSSKGVLCYTSSHSLHCLITKL